MEYGAHRSVARADARSPASGWPIGHGTGRPSFPAESSSASHGARVGHRSGPLLGDEPTGNLDSRAGDEIVRLMRQAGDTSGRTIVDHNARFPHRGVRGPDRLSSGRPDRR